MIVTDIQRDVMAHQVVIMTEVVMSVTDLHMVHHILMVLITVVLLAHHQDVDNQTAELTGNLNVLRQLGKAEEEVIIENVDLKLTFCHSCFERDHMYIHHFYFQFYIDLT